MNLSDLLDHLRRAGVIVEPQEDGRLRAVAVFEDQPLTAETRELCRQHKQVLLDYLCFAQEADRLLLASTARIAQAWPEGCDVLDHDPTWDVLETQLHTGYWEMDLDRLRTVIEMREDYVLAVLAARTVGDTRVPTQGQCRCEPLDHHPGHEPSELPHRKETTEPERGNDDRTHSHP